MEQKNALIFQGGWDGHEPALVSARFAKLLQRNGFEVTVSDTLDILADGEGLMHYALIVPCYTMGEINHDYTMNISKAVAAGTGLAGCHGGMNDAFRNDTDWQFMTGAQWVSHPGGDGISYRVNLCRGSSPITEGLEDFDVCSEQYYLHIDPSIEVLATTRFPVYEDFHVTNRPVDMPVAYTKFWGKGKIFYLSLGHHDDVFEKYPTAETLMERGMLWAARSTGSLIRS